MVLTKQKFTRENLLPDSLDDGDEETNTDEVVTNDTWRAIPVEDLALDAEALGEDDELWLIKAPPVKVCRGAPSH